MLPLSQIASLRDTVDHEWRSPVADAVGERWGMPEGTLRFWRSSAAHVFVAPPGADPRGVLYARFAPATEPAGGRLARGSRFHSRLAAAGAAVAQSFPSLAGAALELVRTPLGDMYASVAGKVDGDELDVEGIDAGAAAAWGAALGAFQDAAGPLAVPLQPDAPAPFDALAEAASVMADPELEEAAKRLAGLMAAGPAVPLVMGHGDFELDNLRWTDRGFTGFDFDEARVMTAAADVASAARDLLGPQPGFPEYPELLAAFLDGYRCASGIGLGPRELVLPRADFAAQQLLEAPHVLDINPARPGWLHDLAGSLRVHYGSQRSILLATAEVLA